MENETRNYSVLETETIALFTRAYGEKPEVFACAPGRVNIIGEHVDYNGGLVLPAAIEQSISMTIRRREEGVVNIRSSSSPDRFSFSTDQLDRDPEGGWSNYIRGVLFGLKEAGKAVPGFDAFYHSTLPVGSGLSSSAALEVVTAVGVLTLSGQKMDGIHIAKLCQTAEHNYAGVPCGLMDQAAVTLCRKDHLLMMNCADDTIEHIPLVAEGWKWMIINSGVSHSLADGEYAKRRSCCEAAAKVLGVKYLSDIDSTDLDKALEHKDLDDAMVGCVRHVVTENLRTKTLIAALGGSDMTLVGRMMNESHTSLRDDYRVSCAELDFIAETAQSLEGVAGCRMTGGGFGGSAIALVKEGSIARVEETISSAYKSKFVIDATIEVTRPAQGVVAYAIS